MSNSFQFFSALLPYIQFNLSHFPDLSISTCYFHLILILFTCHNPPYLLLPVFLYYAFSSKFLLMVRDGRASVHSMISRQVTIAGFDLSSYRDCLSKWSQAIEVMLFQCIIVGSTRCLTIRYENLVLQPRTTMVKVLDFLNVPWHEGVLHHEEAIGQPGGVSLSRSVSIL